MKVIFPLLLLCSPGLFGQLSDPITIRAGWTGLRAVFLADLNEDGAPDIVAFRTAQAAYFLNDGTGNFGPENTLITDVNRPSYLQTGDIDGDGDLDILLAAGEVGSHGRLSWLQNDGALNFTQIDIIPKATLIVKPYACHLADLDGDGDLDAAVTARDNDDVFIAYNQGAGNFSAAQSVNATFDGPVGIDSHDFDGDGAREIFVSNYWPSTGPRVVYLDRQNNGTYVRNTIGMPGYANPTVLDFADVDFDGDQDLVTQFTNGKRVVWSQNNTVTSQINSHQDIWGDSGFAGGVLNSFLVHQTGTTNELYFFTSLHNCYRVTGTPGNFSSPELLFDEGGNSFSGLLRRAAFGDVNNDGAIDVVYANSSEDAVRLRLGSTALPVTYTSFTGERVGDAVDLRWTTQREANNHGFTVERSTDGLDWSALVFVPATASGAYTYSDPIGKYESARARLYRLRQHDLDGTATLSPVRAVDLGRGADYLLSPNPVAGRLRISSPHGGVTHGVIHDLQLRRVADFRFTDTHSLATTGWRAGVYLVTLQHGPEVLRYRIVVKR